MNLVSNAIHAVRARPDGTGTTQVRSFDEETHVRVEVSDNGVGIAPEHRARIFDPSSPPSRSARGPASGSRSATASSNATEAR